MGMMFIPKTKNWYDGW